MKKEKTKTQDGFEVYGRRGYWYWRLRRRGNIVADGSEAYTRKTDAVRAVRALRRWLATNPPLGIMGVELLRKRIYASTKDFDA